MGPIRNPRWEQKWTEGYVIVSNIGHADIPRLCLLRKTNKIARIIGTEVYSGLLNVLIPLEVVGKFNGGER
jgi:hypothetical protein